MSTSHERVLVIGEREHSRLMFKSRMWYAGWTAAIVISTVSSFYIGRAFGAERALARVEQVEEGLADVAALQNKTTDTFIRAWSLQDKTSQVLIDEINYQKMRDELKLANRGLEPTWLVKKQK